MTTTTDPTTTTVLDAMRDLASDADGWRLADALLGAVPTGVQAFGAILDRAKDAGVAGKLTVNTLRLYRDTAKHWPAGQRVPGVSFSAHREAERLNDVAAAAKLLRDIAANNGGPSGVTVVRVRGGVAIKQGRTPPGGKRTAPATAPTAAAGPAWQAAAIADLVRGGVALITALNATDAVSDLDAMHKGLSRVLATVEAHRVRKARKAPAAAPTAPAAVPAVTTPAPAPADVSGDLRGL